MLAPRSAPSKSAFEGLKFRTPDIVPLKPVRFFDPATVACDLENTLANRNRKLEKADRFWFAPE
jgi:hypothetical protein